MQRMKLSLRGLRRRSLHLTKLASAGLIGSVDLGTKMEGKDAKHFVVLEAREHSLALNRSGFRQSFLFIPASGWPVA